MIQKLSPHSGGLALVLDATLLAQLQIDETTPLEVTVQGESLRIAPVKDAARQERLNAALVETNGRYGEILKRLAE